MIRPEDGIREIAGIRIPDSKLSVAALLITAMRKRYPNDAFPVSLELGAKVAKHEMQWG